MLLGILALGAADAGFASTTSGGAGAAAFLGSSVDPRTELQRGRLLTDPQERR